MAALLSVAETAEAVGSALNQFLNPVADKSAEITALIAQCFGTSSALRKLRNAIERCPSPRQRRLIVDDTDDVRQSLEYTFQDVKSVFGGLGRTAERTRAVYRRVWVDLSNLFYRESGLVHRLEQYRQFLRGLVETLYEGEPRDLDEFDHIRDCILTILEQQEDERLADHFEQTSLDEEEQASM
ncbi:hypothetical protein ACLMJK_003237 [Lecanora helva]